MLTIAQAVREALKIADPEGPRDRILLIANSKLVHSGGKGELKSHNVSQVVCDIKKALGKEKLAKEDIVIYEQQRNAKLIKHADSKPLAPVCLPKVVESLPSVGAKSPDPSYAQLKAAAEFARLAGGVERAVELLQALVTVQASANGRIV